MLRSSCPEVFGDVLKTFAIFTAKHLCWSPFLINFQAFTPKEKQAPPQVFCCEYCNIFKNTYFEKHLQMTAFACCILFT